MNLVKRSFVDGPYGQIHVRTSTPKSPTKRPIVFLHMFPQSGRNFHTLLPHVAHDRIAVAPDFPGHGESTIPPSPIKAEDYARSIWVAIEQLGLLRDFDSIDLFGIHAGAKLTVAMANQHPDWVHRVMLCAAAVLYKEELEHMQSVYQPIPLDDEGTRFQTLWSMLLNNRAEGVTLEMAAIGLAEMIRGGEAYEWGHHSVFDYNAIFPEQLAALKHEIALLNPGDDLREFTPRSEAYLQNGRLYERPHWKHGFLDLCAEDLAVQIAAFMDGGLSALSSLDQESCA